LNIVLPLLYDMSGSMNGENQLLVTDEPVEFEDFYESYRPF
jgi:hypothetical protein